MKKTMMLMGALAISAAVAQPYPAPYAADVSTPEKKAALTEKLWQHDFASDVRIWPADRLPAGAMEKPYVFTENELFQSNLVIDDIINPQFSFFPAKGEGPHPAAVVFPGGGYFVLGWNKEGTEIAEWLNSIGFSAFVLLYRTDDRAGALTDAQRTMGLIRQNAEKYGIDPHRLGVIGFSAGANLAIALSTNWRTRGYPRVDAADDYCCRPDFTLPIYPWDIRPRLKADDPFNGGWAPTLEIRAEYPVDPETPPAFVGQAIDDFCQPETALAYVSALKRAGVDAELKIYPNGGHGFGFRRLGTACDVMRYDAANWLARFADPIVVKPWWKIW